MDNEEKSFNDLVSEKLKKKKRKIKRHTVIMIGLSILLILSTLVMFKEIVGKKHDFGIIGRNCHGAKILSILGYSEETKTLSINGVYFCSGKDKKTYDSISAVMYEKVNTPIEVSKFAPGSNITIEDYIKQLYIEVEDYYDVCPSYNNETLYLDVTTKKDDAEKMFKVALDLGDSCVK